jgi:DNA-binding PadR family transcriptional regulator
VAIIAAGSVDVRLLDSRAIAEHYPNRVCFYPEAADMTRDSLGEFEQVVLLAILQLDGDVYGVPIVDEIERRTGREVSPAAVYVTLRRLERKGLVQSWMSDPTPERGGKPRMCVKVTKTGLSSLRASRHTIDRMWQGLDPALRRHR